MWRIWKGRNKAYLGMRGQMIGLKRAVEEFWDGKRWEKKRDRIGLDQNGEGKVLEKCKLPSTSFKKI